MSSATTTSASLPLLGGYHHFLLRRLHSLTGLVFGGYLVVHLLINATLIEASRHGLDIFQLQVDKIHSLPFLLVVEWAVIYLPIIYHTIYGIWITFSGKSNIGNYPYEKNWFYVFQRASAIVIVLFMIFHVLGMKGAFGSRLAFVPAHFATQSAAYHIQAHWSVAYVIYPLGVLASCYHLANGFWTAGITWGLTISASAQRRWGWVCAGLFALTFIAGMVALVALISAAKVTDPTWLRKT